MHESTNLTNHFLIAMPNLGDPNFHQTVTFLCQHSEEGALGIVINRPTKMKLGDIFGQMNIDQKKPNIASTPVFFGGPVQPERGFVIHESNQQWESTLKISDSIALTTSRDVLEAIAAGNGPEKSLVALGYAGWGHGQLEQEMIDNAWLSAPAEATIIFDMPTKKRWKAAAEKMGIDINLLSSTVGHG